ncbi:hypothetical protein CLD22_22265 [Rubrivivax gelatinosus]|nr:hypothetical protein [Rubrivivax gelatinosus]
MNARPLFALCSLLAAGAIAQAAEPAPADEVVFRFAPPDGTRVTTVYTLERRRTTPDEPPVSDKAEARFEGRFRRVDGGFEFSQRTLSSSLERNGQQVQDPVLQRLETAPFSATISAQGELTEVRGFAEVEALLRATWPPEQAAALAAVVNEATLAARARSDWNGRYARFAGATVQIGDVFDVQAPQPLPTGGSLTYTIRTSFPRWEPCPSGRCVRVEQVYESDSAALAEITNQLARRLAGASSATAPAAATPGPSARITGSLSRLIDPATMLIHSERIERTLVLPLQGPGSTTTTATQYELRHYVHTYEAP